MTNKAVIFGSGFSKAIYTKMPTTNELTKEIKYRIESQEFTTLNQHNQNISDIWKKYIVDKNIGNIEESGYGNFEEILSYLDDVHPWKDPYDKLDHQKLYKALIPLIVEIINEAQKGINYQKILEKDDAYLAKFINKIKKDKIPIISFNYDTIFEGLLINTDESATKEGFDYFKTVYEIICRGIFDKSGVVMSFNLNFANNPKLIKLHGSKNWLYQPNSQEIIFDEEEFLTPQDLKRVKGDDNDFGKDNLNHEAIRTSKMELIKKQNTVLIIPPTQNKTPSYMNIDQIKHQWLNAREILSQANEVHIIGYSSPSTDLSTTLMLKDSINRKDCKVSVCYKNGPDSDGLENRYEKALNNVKSNLNFSSNGFNKEWVEKFFL